MHSEQKFKQLQPVQLCIILWSKLESFENVQWGSAAMYSLCDYALIWSTKIWKAFDKA
jgi:hypothetical protein